MSSQALQAEKPVTAGMDRSEIDKSPYPAIGKLLLHSGRLDKLMIERAYRLSRENEEPFDLVLTRLGLIAEAELAHVLAEELGLEVAATGRALEASPFNQRLSGKFLKQHRVILVDEGPGKIAAVMADPTDEPTLAAIMFALERPVGRQVGCASDVEAAWDRFFGTQEASNPEQRPEDDAEEDVDRLKDMASEAPVVRLVNQIIGRSIELRASDIHLEPMPGRLRLRYRVDGLLQEGEQLPERLKSAIASRIKVMAKLNIAERRLAQDGRIRVPVRGHEIDLRISTTPTIHGEGIVMRILDKSGVTLAFDSLGYTEAMIKQFREVLHRPYGIILVTGPTGSGKTTSLYTALTELNQTDVKILTIEDPIEYQMDGVNQVAVKPSIGLTFATALRSFLRQDPDIMMIGEIRDLETAEIAVQAALTGHLVLSTLHTNDAAGAIGRLLDMGVEDYLLTSTINGIINQRLVRRLCQACKAPHKPVAEQIEPLRRSGLVKDFENLMLWRAEGCSECGGGGFTGRLTVMELLILSDPIRKLILSKSDASAIARQAVAEGMMPIYVDGMSKAIAGLTTVEEVLRVTQDT